MSTNKVSKLVIKACSDNKFSSFIGEFITSINPEDLTIKSAVAYHVPDGMSSSSLLKYRGSPPKELSFSLLFDNTGIIPGSNTIAVMEQVKQLQDIAYSVHKKHNAPNYIRVIWGQIDFKGRLVDLDIVYSMFQANGTLVRAEAHIAVLEELIPVGKGKSAVGVDSDYTKPSGAGATSKGSLSQRGDVPPSYNEAVGPPPSYEETFKPTPNGMNGAYSGAPPGAYDGGPDQVYQGSNGGGGRSPRSPRSVSSVESTSSNGSSINTAPSVASSPDMDHSGKGFKGGVAGNGPGGSGGGVGGGGHVPGSGAGKPGAAAAPAGSPASRSGKSHGPGSSPAGAPKKGGVAAGPGGGKAAGKGGMTKGGSLAAGVAGGAAAAAAASGADSLRKVADLKGKLSLMKEKASFFRRLQKFLKKVVPKKVYEAGKELGKKI